MCSVQKYLIRPAVKSPSCFLPGLALPRMYLYRNERIKTYICFKQGKPVQMARVPSNEKGANIHRAAAEFLHRGTYSEQVPRSLLQSPRATRIPVRRDPGWRTAWGNRGSTKLRPCLTDLPRELGREDITKLVHHEPRLPKIAKARVDPH